MRYRLLTLIGAAAMLAGCATRPAPTPAQQACRSLPALVTAKQYQAEVTQAELCLGNPALPPAARALVLSLQADGYTNLKRYPEAIAAKRASIEVAPPANGWATLELSRIYTESGNYAEALKLVQANLDQGLGEAGKGRGFNMPTYYHMGRALNGLQRYHEAAEALSAGLIKQPGYAWAYYSRALAYEGLGERAEAKADLQRYSERLNGAAIGADEQATLQRFGLPLPPAH
ncbi:N-acetylglucosamine transferase [Pseudomonas sp. NPDC007930]|uniref:N-acetylglucosamine transferase n=1 Tax=Pseudomonas sp. NPDC007930 TaxID=3364417 RepID=UPI0036EC4B2D